MCYVSTCVYTYLHIYVYKHISIYVHSNIRILAYKHIRNTRNTDAARHVSIPYLTCASAFRLRQRQPYVNVISRLRTRPLQCGKPFAAHNRYGTETVAPDADDDADDDADGRYNRRARNHFPQANKPGNRACAFRTGRRSQKRKRPSRGFLADLKRYAVMQCDICQRIPPMPEFRRIDCRPGRSANRLRAIARLVRGRSVPDGTRLPANPRRPSSANLRPVRPYPGFDLRTYARGLVPNPQTVCGFTNFCISPRCNSGRSAPLSALPVRRSGASSRLFYNVNRPQTRADHCAR